MTTGLKDGIKSSLLTAVRGVHVARGIAVSEQVGPNWSTFADLLTNSA